MPPRPFGRNAIARWSTVALVAMLLTVATAASPHAALAYGGDGLRASVNAYRTDPAYGIPPIPGTALLDDVATARAADMAGNARFEHDMDYVRARLVAAGVCFTGYGEIIAYNRDTPYSYDGTVLQWWNSPLHHAIMMSTSYNAAGGAWQQGADGANYSVMVFATLCPPDLPALAYGPTPFTDIATSAFRSDIEWLYTSGITAGCDADSFCPTATVTRAQMASFIARALDLPPATRDYFTDDTGLSHEPDINRLAEAGIAGGCASGRYCPSAPVTRDQMASFLVRAVGLSAGAGVDLFDDDNGNGHEPDIDRLAYSGVTAGCADRRYCPGGSVTRGQMAAFLHRAFGG